MQVKVLGQYPRTKLGDDKVALKWSSRRCAGKTFSDPTRTAKFAALNGNCWPIAARHSVEYQRIKLVDFEQFEGPLMTQSGHFIQRFLDCL